MTRKASKLLEKYSVTLQYVREGFLKQEGEKKGKGW